MCERARHCCQTDWYRQFYEHYLQQHSAMTRWVQHLNHQATASCHCRNQTAEYVKPELTRYFSAGLTAGLNQAYHNQEYVYPLGYTEPLHDQYRCYAREANEQVYPNDEYSSGENRYTLDYEKDEKLVLPTAPKAARGPDVDLSKVPTSPPFTAFLGNLPYDVQEEDIVTFFRELQVQNVRLPRDTEKKGRIRGFGFAEFLNRQDLIQALALNKETMKNRVIRVSLAGVQDGDRGDRRDAGPDRTLGDWRSDRKDQMSRDEPSRNGDVSSSGDDDTSDENEASSDESEEEDFEIVDSVVEAFEYVQLDKRGKMPKKFSVPEKVQGRVSPPFTARDRRNERDLRRTLYGDKAKFVASKETAASSDFNRNCDLYQPDLWPAIPLRLH